MPKKPDFSRRRLITFTPVAGAASLLVAKGATAGEEPVPVKQDPRQPTFEETDHVKTFYRLARK